ncbi:MAG: FAD-dependent monooxygenase [Pseudomonadota bacterium]
MDNPGTPPIFPPMDATCDTIIVGGGLNGSVLALALASIGQTVAVVDAIAEPVRRDAGFDGRAYALALTSQRLLSALGIWNHVSDVAQPMLEIKVTDGKVGRGPSPFFMHFNHAEIEEGPMGYMVEDRHLRRALLDMLAEESAITHIAGRTVSAQAFEKSGVSVTLDDGQVISAALLVGADGRGSQTAARAGIGRMAWGYDQLALVCAVEHEKPHMGVAHQFFTPGGPLAILPLTENRSSIVWSERKELAETLSRLPDDAFLDALRPRFGDFLGEIRLAGIRFSYPLGLSLANSFVADRVALVGDAAHGIHPIAGQGLNAGLRDIAALAETVASASRRGEDFGAPDVLHRYQQWRRFDTATLALATDTFNSLFSNDNPLLRAGRDLGMGIVNAVPGLRRGFIREAAGLTGDVPVLMQGRPL